mmetsp:Transcript_28544/g.71749  ORF Transcript_28544/g.71749 Transcript_28544/m.71749 type:complete len:230 (+) Transcript_28544:2063-2752(+)
MTILFMVSVPVLSLHNMFIPARSSIADKRDTIAPNRDIWRDPSARVVVVTISIAIGMDATITTTVKARVSVSGSPSTKKRYRKHMPLSTRERATRTTMTLSSMVCMLLRSSFGVSSAAVRPKNEFFPVCTTVASVSPVDTVAPIFAIMRACSVTGSDSPVMALSSASITPSFSMQSAGMAAPNSSWIRSPGTSRAALKLWSQFPSRFTTAVGFSDFFSASTALPAFCVS